jgi:hypothetical protein
MKLIKLNQQGVSRLTLVAGIVVLAMIAVVIFAFRSPGGTTGKTTTTTNNNLPSGYTRYSTTDGKFSIGYPSDWFVPDNMKACGGNVLLMAADPDYLGTCGTDEQSQVYIASFVSDMRDSYVLVEGRGYDSASGVPYTLAGVTGLRQTGIAKTQTGTGALEDGAQVVMYTFYTKGRTYVAQYIQQSGAPDEADIFDIIVKTLRFRP